MEYWTEKGDFVPEAFLMFILINVLKALCYIHSNGFIHQDIKPEHIYVMSGGKVKLGDFGLFKILSSPDDEIPLENGTSKYYQPPEVYQKTGTGFQADIWPLGLICLEAITGKICYKSYSLLEDDPNSYFEVR
jgi:cyclin-dependent kinase 2